MIGPLADSRRDTIRPWVFDYDLAETVTVLQGIQERAGQGVEVSYAPGIRPAQRTFPSMFDMWGDNAPVDPAGFDDAAELERAVTLARDADVAVLVLGEWQNMIGEAASRSSIELPGRQLELLQAVVATGTPTVLLVMNGRRSTCAGPPRTSRRSSTSGIPAPRAARPSPTCSSRTSPPAKTAVQLAAHRWPGPDDLQPHDLARTRQAGPALLGRAEHPAVPVRARTVLRPLRVHRPHLDRSSIQAGETLTVSVTVTNAGQRAGDEVAQLYIQVIRVRIPAGAGTQGLPASRPRRRRVPDAALPARPRQLRFWNAATRDWVIDTTTIDVFVGGDSTAAQTVSFTIGS